MKQIIPLFAFIFCTAAGAQDPTPLVDQALDAVGGKDKLLTAFRMTEFYNSGENAEPVGGKKRKARTSVIEMPGSWKVRGRERGREPGKDVVRAWSLDLLVDPKSNIALIPDLVDEDVLCAGLQISGSVTPSMKLYFDRKTHLLKRVDWREDFYRFRDWRDLDGLKYSARTSIFKLKTGKAWFHHEITGLKRLTEVPTGKAKP